MIDIKYIKTDKGWYVGYINFGGQNRFGGVRDNPELLKKRILANLMSAGYKVSEHGKLEFTVTETDISELPLSELAVKYYNRWFVYDYVPEQYAKKDKSKAIPATAPTDTTLPTADYGASEPAACPPADGCEPIRAHSYQIIGNQLIVYGEIARYTIG